MDCSPSVSDVGGGGDGEGWQVNKWWHLVILAKRIKSLKVFVLSLVVADVLVELNVCSLTLTTLLSGFDKLEVLCSLKHKRDKL